jgi:nitrate reductase NapAB chaperone NapD
MEQLNVRLGLDVIYVNGTVNGIEATFSLVEVGLWSAVVDKAQDGKYVVVITAYNSLGTSTTLKTTIYKLDGLIQSKLDWTQWDYYNAEDLIRVEANTQFVAEYLESMGYIAGLQGIKADWTMLDSPSITEINRVEHNIDALQQCFYAPEGWQDRKIWSKGKKFSWEDALRYEKNLHLLTEMINLIKDATVYAGTFCSGQEVI